MPKIGDYVLVHHIKRVEHTNMDGEPLPVWACIKSMSMSMSMEFTYSATLCNPKCSGTWGIDDDDIVEHPTDEQWAELAKSIG
jgi:hypothetical protein